MRDPGEAGDSTTVPRHYGRTRRHPLPMPVRDPVSYVIGQAIVAIAVVLVLWGLLSGDADLAAGGVTTFACLPAAGLAKLARSR